MSRLIAQGDPLLVPTREGLDLDLRGGIIGLSGGLENAIYLSLFGGNYRDSGRVGDRNEWVGNYVMPASSRLRSEFQFLLFSVPLTSSSRTLLVEAAKRDLRWLVPTYADKISVDVTIESRNRVGVSVVVEVGNTKKTYEFWSGEMSRLLASQTSYSGASVQALLDPSTLAPPDLSQWGQLVMAYGPEYVSVSGSTVTAQLPWPSASLQVALDAPSGSAQPTLVEWGVGNQKAVTYGPGAYRSPTAGWSTPVIGSNYCQAITWRHDSLGTTRRLFTMYHGSDTVARPGDVWVYGGGELCWHIRPGGASAPLFNILSRSGTITAGGRYTLVIVRKGHVVSLWLNGEQLGEAFVGNLPTLSGAYYGPTIGAYPGGSTADGQITVRNAALWNAAPDPIAFCQWSATTFGSTDLISQGNALLQTSLSTYYGEDAVGTVWPAALGKEKQSLTPVASAVGQTAWGSYQVPRFTGSDAYGLTGTAVWPSLSGARPYSIVTLAFGEPNGASEQGIVSLGVGSLSTAFTYMYRLGTGLMVRSQSSGAVGTPLAGTTWNFGLLHDAAGGLGYRHVSGEGASGAGETAYSYNRFTVGSLRRTGGVEQGFVGKVAAVAVFDRTLSNAEFAAVRAALAAKYGAPLPPVSSFGELLYSYGTESAMLSGSDVTSILPADGTVGPTLNGGGTNPDVSTSWGYGQQSDIRATAAGDGKSGSWTRPGTVQDYTIACVFSRLEAVNGRLCIIRKGPLTPGDTAMLGALSAMSDGSLYWYVSPTGTLLTGNGGSIAIGTRNTAIIQRVGATASIFLNGSLLASGNVGTTAVPSQVESVHYLDDPGFVQTGKHAVRSLMMWKSAPSIPELQAWLKAKYGTV